MNFTFEELADMHLIYGKSGRNGRLAQRMYRENFPGRNRIPNFKTFENVDRRLRETGSFLITRRNAGIQRTVRNYITEEEILNYAAEHPSESSRSIARVLHVSSSSVWRTLHEQQLYPYRLRKVQALKPEDYPDRIEFSRWFLSMWRNNPEFIKQVLYTDEAKFTREGIFNSRNSHIWAEENPFAIHPHGHQTKFSLNVWAGIVENRLVGPYLLPDNLNGDNYSTFLGEVLPELLEDVPLNIRNGMWFQHDGASVHFSLAAREYLNRKFGDNWIGRGGPHKWPARSPDLNPVDYFLWGHMKSLVYETEPNSQEALVARIQAASITIAENLESFEKVRFSMLRRCRSCISVDGKNFEQLPY